MVIRSKALDLHEAGNVVDQSAPIKCQRVPIKPAFLSSFTPEWASIESDINPLKIRDLE